MHLERSSWRCVRDACRPRPCGPFLSSGNAGVIVTAAAVPDLGRCAVRGVVRCSCWGCMYILLLCCLSVSRLLGAVHCLYVHKSFACLCPVSCHALLLVHPSFCMSLHGHTGAANPRREKARMQVGWVLLGALQLVAVCCICSCLLVLAQTGGWPIGSITLVCVARTEL